MHIAYIQAMSNREGVSNMHSAPHYTPTHLLFLPPTLLIVPFPQVSMAVLLHKEHQRKKVSSVPTLAVASFQGHCADRPHCIHQ